MGKTIGRRISRSAHKYWQFYLCLIPVIAYFVIFHYWPMWGVQIAFRDYNPIDGILGSPFVGFKHFLRFFNSYQFARIIRNTLGISLYQLAIAFPAPIILAILLSELRSNEFRKTMQMLTYAPHFLSVVVVVGMMTTMLSPRTGIVNLAIRALGGEAVFFMAEPGWFKSLYVFSGIWQNCGWSSIIYIAAITGIDPNLFEAAVVDGASTFKRIIHVTLPSIMPTIIILLILQCGHLMSVGFEKVFLMQNSLNMPASDVISTYVYRAGMVDAQISFASAVGLFNSVINCTLLVIVNTFAKKSGEISLF
ncbi:MAG: ABC transporter permease subunit [Treponema sp.]|jgi:putative aldouronate transport system permease protein|nr:ABC transporter permease subunit [Treponema sp.]